MHEFRDIFFQDRTKHIDISSLKLNVESYKLPKSNLNPITIPIE